MKNEILIVISLILLTLVLIGVTVIQPLLTIYPWIQPFMPMIVITGFFTFLVSVALFIFSLIKNIK